MNKLRVAIDSGPLTGGHSVRGIGFHTKILIEYLKKNPELSLDVIDFKINKDLLKKEKFDVLHYPSFYPYFLTLPFKKYSKVVVTIHDLIPLVYPKNYPGGIRGNLKFLLQKQLIKKVDAIITISETSKKDICRFLGIEPEKIYVTYLAARKIFNEKVSTNTLLKVKEKYKLPDKFVLYVGGVNYNKNIVRLAEACKMANLKLVIVGKHASDSIHDENHIEDTHLNELINRFGSDKDIMRLGFVEETDLRAIYSLADIYCQPSLYEGFGLPVVEAFASGVSVVAAKNNCLVEIANDAAEFFDPKDVKNIADTLKKVSNNEKLKEELIKKGLERNKDFSWEESAKKTFEVYKKVSQKP